MISHSWISNFPGSATQSSPSLISRSFGNQSTCHAGRSSSLSSSSASARSSSETVAISPVLRFTNAVICSDRASSSSVTTSNETGNAIPAGYREPARPVLSLDECKRLVSATYCKGGKLRLTFACWSRGLRDTDRSQNGCDSPYPEPGFRSLLSYRSTVSSQAVRGAATILLIATCRDAIGR